MTGDTEDLPNDINALKELLSQKEKENQKLRENNLRLEERINLLTHQLFGRKSERLTAEEVRQGLLFNEIETYADGKTEPEKVTIKVKKSSRGRRTGRKALPASLPRVEIVHDLPEEEKNNRRFIGSDFLECLAIIPEKVFVERHIYHKYALPEGVVIEGVPALITARKPRLIPKSITSAALVAYLLTAKFCDALPFYRLEKIFARWDVEIRRATMCNWAKYTARRCERVLELLWEQALRGSLMGIDETTVQVMMEPNRKNTAKSYMWVIRAGPPERPVIFYKYRETRQAKFLLEMLAGYRGCIQTDGYDAYHEVASKLNLDHAGCWDHVRRKFHDVVKGAGRSGKAEAALRLIGRLYRLEEHSRNLGLSNDEIRDLRLNKSARRLAYFKKWLDKNVTTTPPRGLLGSAMNYTLNEWNKLTVYLEQGHISISNILVENAVRPFVVGRKNWMFSGSPSGAASSAAIYTLIETAKANGLEPYWYLRYLFEKLPQSEEDGQLLEILPTAVSMEQIREFFKTEEAAA